MIQNKPVPLSEAEIFKLKQRELEILKSQLELVEGLPHLHGFKWYNWARAFFESENRENFLCAANQISKSSTQIRKCIDWATDVSKFSRRWPSLQPGQTPNQFWYFYPTFEVAQTEFETKWEPQFLPRGKFKDDPVYGWKAVYDKGFIKKLEFNSGVTVYFKAYSQKVRDLQSGTVYALFADEEMPVELLPELQARLNSSDGYFHMVFTATLGQLYWEQTMEPASKIDERYPDAFKQCVSLYDCQTYEDGTPSHWTDAKIKRAIAKCPTENEVKRRILGRFVKTEGLMFPSFDYEINTVDFHPIPKHWLQISGVDPGTGGTAHPAAIVFIAVSPDFKQGRVWRAWRGDKINTASPDIYAKYKDLRGRLQMFAQKYDHASREFFLHVSSKGEAFSPADKEHLSGYSLLNTLFRSGMLKIMRGDPMGETDKLIVEIRSLSSTGDKRKAIDDLCDATRYAAQAVPWDFSDMDIEDDGPDQLQERKDAPKKTGPELRREWFMGKEESADPTIEDELDFWNEHFES
jgi:hypothetical protein